MAAVTAELNYFTYFSDIEEHFWRKRGAHILVSPLDWAILETWQKASIPLEAVLAGIDRAFESYGRSKRGAAGRPLKSLAYCVDSVLDAAERWKEAHAGTNPAEARSQKPASAESFSRDELRAFFERVQEKLAAAAATCSARVPELAARVGECRQRHGELLPLLETPGWLDTEDLERRLTVLEEKLVLAVEQFAEDDAVLNARRELDRSLAPYRRKMTAAQIAALEKQFLRKRLFEEYGLPRLSLFYI